MPRCSPSGKPHRCARIGVGRLRTRPVHVLADRAYSSREMREYLRRRQLPHTIPDKRGQAGRRRRGSAATPARLRPRGSRRATTCLRRAGRRQAAPAVQAPLCRAYRWSRTATSPTRPPDSSAGAGAERHLMTTPSRQAADQRRTRSAGAALAGAGSVINARHASSSVNERQPSHPSGSTCLSSSFAYHLFDEPSEGRLRPFEHPIGPFSVTPRTILRWRQK